MSRLYKWQAMKRKKPLVTSRYCIVGTVAVPIISNTPHRNEVFTMFVFFWLFHCDPPKIFIIKATFSKGRLLKRQTLRNLTLTMKILGREYWFQPEENKIYLAESEVIVMLQVDSVCYEQCCYCRKWEAVQSMQWVEGNKAYACGECFDGIPLW